LPLTPGRNAVGCEAPHGLDAAPRRSAPRVVEETPCEEMEDGMARAPTEQPARSCRVIRSTEEYQGKQGPTYAGGISAETVGAQAIWLGMIRMPPGARTKAHFHAEHETAMYVVSGEADLWYGEDLSHREIARAGDYLLYPGGHLAHRRQPQPDGAGHRDRRSNGPQRAGERRAPTGTGRRSACSGAVSKSGTGKAG
jgi:uncharacterized RmlC-like cupin family protein